MLHYLIFTSNTTLSSFFLFFFIIDLYFLIPAAMAQIFNPPTELAIPTGMPTKEAKAEIETHPVLKKLKCVSLKMCNSKLYKPFCASYSSFHFGLFLQ